MKFQHELLISFSLILALVCCETVIGAEKVQTTKLKKPYRTIKSSLTITDFAFSPDGKSLVFGDYDVDKYSGHLTLWNLLSGKKVWSVPCNSRVYCFSPDGKKIAILTDNNYEPDYIELRNADSGRLITKINSSYELGIMRFSPDGKSLVVASYIERPDNQVILMFDVATRKLKKVYKPSTALGAIWDVGISRKGSYLVAVTATSCELTLGLAMWNIRTGKQILAAITSADATGHMDLYFRTDGKTLVFAELIFDFSKRNSKLKRMINLAERVCFGLYSEKSAIYCNGDHTLELWDIGSRKLMHKWTGSGCDYHEPSAFSRCSKLLATQVSDKVIKVWSLKM